MADLTASSMETTESLGVGSIIGETFSIFFKRLVPILALGFVITFLSLLISGALVGFDFVAASPVDAGATPFPDAGPVSFVLMMFVSFAAYGLLIGAMVLLAYDAKLGRTARIGTYIGAALKHIVPILILTVVFTIISAIGFALLIVPGLWIYAVFSVFIPAIVIEGAGFGAFGRSASLTKGFRWPIVGVIIVMGLLMMVISVVLVLILAFPLAAIGGGSIGGIIAQSLGSGLSYGLGAIPVALIYARLREIKEGVSVDSLADVFA